jgi:hypothetical protein
MWLTRKVTLQRHTHSLIVALTTLCFLAGSNVYAQCGVGDPTCPPWKWNRSPISLPRPSSGGSQSCLAVMSYPKDYNWSLRNDNNYNMQFLLDGKVYRVDPGRMIAFTSKVGSYCTSSCSCSATYSEPIIEFDRFMDDIYTPHRVTVQVSRYSLFAFWTDGRTRMFSSVTPR